jgi:choice-of-anchor B domain-containing protein
MSRLLILAAALPLLASPSPAAPQTSATAPIAARAMVGLGTAVAISGNRLFVSRTGEFPDFAVPPGRLGGVHVFEQVGGSWTESGELSTELPAGSGFGAAIAADGDRVLVGAPKTNEATGTAVLFERTGGAWRVATRLTPVSAAPGDAAGSAVALVGDMALVGAPGRAPAGEVFVFRQAGGVWREVGRLTPGPLREGARFGTTVVAREGRAVVGAPGPQARYIEVEFMGAPEYHAGSVFVFDRTGDQWRRMAALTSADGTVRTLGAALLLDGDDLFAGAPLTRGRGAVVHFTRDGDQWREVGQVMPGDSASVSAYGTALAQTSGDLLVGAPGAGAGHVKVMRRGENGVWSDAQDLTVEPRGPMVRFGQALAAAGDVAVSGAPGDDFFEGTGFVLRRGADGVWAIEARAVDDGGMADAVTGEPLECTDGGAGRFDCADVDLVSFLPSSALGAGRGIWISDLWGWTDPVDGREIAIVGRIDGTAFVDLSDPANPIYLGELPLTEGAQPNLWRDMKVYADHAFIVADNAGRHGMQVFDLTQLRDVTAPPVTFEPTTTYFGIHSAHNIAIDEETGFAYTVGNSAGGQTCGGHPHMIDIRNPTEPTFAGCYVIPNSPGTHDLQCVVYHGPDGDYAGRELCFSSAATLLDIGDVTDKTNPISVAQAQYPNLAYAHQGWLSDDHRYFYMDDELDEVSGGADRTRTLIFDVADLDDPVLVNQYMGETAATDHNLYVQGRYVYESNYVAGLRVLDVSDPVRPVEVGHFDTVPSSPNTPGFAGSWSNYPYFRSGIIVVTSIMEGLFILKYRGPVLVP